MSDQHTVNDGPHDNAANGQAHDNYRYGCHRGPDATTDIAVQSTFRSNGIAPRHDKVDDPENGKQEASDHQQHGNVFVTVLDTRIDATTIVIDDCHLLDRLLWLMSSWML